MPQDDEFRILLIQRAREPFKGLYALPGGFVEIQESLEEAAFRELREETGFVLPQLTQIHTFSSLDRDPRGRVISTCFGAIMSDSSSQIPQAGSDAADCAWFNIENLPHLAFDHEHIIRTALEKFLTPFLSP
jgi:8-oxo-dGTP diphosphatase